MTSERSAHAIDPEAVVAAQAAAPPDDLLDLVVAAFQALADPTRARILYALVQRPLCVRDLAIVAGVSESAVSHQLRLLRDRWLVKPRRAGSSPRHDLSDTCLHSPLAAPYDGPSLV